MTISTFYDTEAPLRRGPVRMLRAIVFRSCESPTAPGPARASLRARTPNHLPLASATLSPCSLADRSPLSTSFSRAVYFPPNVCRVYRAEPLTTHTSRNLSDKRAGDAGARRPRSAARRAAAPPRVFRGPRPRAEQLAVSASCGRPALSDETTVIHTLRRLRSLVLSLFFSFFPPFFPFSFSIRLAAAFTQCAARQPLPLTSHAPPPADPPLTRQ